jgi:hypothetical protein
MADERGPVTFDCNVNLLRPVTEQFITEYWCLRAARPLTRGSPRS